MQHLIEFSHDRCCRLIWQSVVRKKLSLLAYIMWLRGSQYRIRHLVHILNVFGNQPLELRVYSIYTLPRQVLINLALCNIILRRALVLRAHVE